jgi:hypothetical protein
MVLWQRWVWILHVDKSMAAGQFHVQLKHSVVDPGGSQPRRSELPEMQDNKRDPFLSLSLKQIIFILEQINTKKLGEP